MKPIVFCGPSLGESERREFQNYEFVPPVRQGELYAALDGKPAAIGIVDGYFDGQPAVWHKEILWALSQGVAVFGAASMGALRAAELHGFGMRGVGKIFEDFRDGVLEDDDEVALIHGPADTGYIPLSEPMVNIRATVAKAVDDAVIDAVIGEQLVKAAKNLFYQERKWPALFDLAGIDDAHSRQFNTWLATNRIDQKRLDAVAMLKAMRTHLDAGVPREIVNFHFEWTDAWEAAPWRCASDVNAGNILPQDLAILDELRLQGSYAELRRAALLRLLAMKESQRSSSPPDRASIVRQTQQFRGERGLWRQAELASWAKEHDTGLADIDRMIMEQATVEHIARQRDRELAQTILDMLRESGSYDAVRRRARAKQRWRDHGNTETGLLPYVLLNWFFGSVRKEPVPSSLEEAAITLGVPERELLALLETEFGFARSNDLTLAQEEQQN